jgi:hypothetical protein
VLCVEPPAEIFESAVLEDLCSLHLILYTHSTTPSTVLFVEFPKARPFDNVLKPQVQYANASKTNASVAFEDRRMYTPQHNRGEIRERGARGVDGDTGEGAIAPIPL